MKDVWLTLNKSDHKKLKTLSAKSGLKMVGCLRALINIEYKRQTEKVNEYNKVEDILQLIKDSEGLSTYASNGFILTQIQYNGN